MQPVQDLSLGHGGDDLPRDQAAADRLVRRRPLDRDGEERNFLGRTRASSRGVAADRRNHNAREHGDDGPAPCGHATRRAGGDGRRLSRQGTPRRQAGPRRAGQHALRSGGLDWLRGPAKQVQAGAGRGFLQARDRASRRVLTGPQNRSRHRPPRLLEHARRTYLHPPLNRNWLETTGRVQGAPQATQHDPRQVQEREHWNLTQARHLPRRTLPRPFRLRSQPSPPAQHHDPVLHPAFPKYRRYSVRREGDSAIRIMKL